MNKIKEAIVLAGGFGTRLKSVVSEIPKPMAPVHDKPFLEYLLHYLHLYGIERVVLSVGYKKEVIQEYFGHAYKGMELVYAIEESPLGTGGGIKLALTYVKSEHALILNGDTFFEVNLNKLSDQFFATKADLTLSLKEMRDFDRYGVVTYENQKITGFRDKQYCKHGWINGGVYAIRSRIFDKLRFKQKFSFENDFMEKYHSQLSFSPFLSTHYFIDIGIPEDYTRSQSELTAIDVFKQLN